MDAVKQEIEIDRDAMFSRFPAVSVAQRPREDILRRLCRMTAATSGLSVMLEDDFSSVSPVAVRLKNNELVEVDPALTLGGFHLLGRDNPLALPFMKRLVGGMMQPIALARRELVDDFNWYSSEYVSRNRLGRGIDDCLLSAVDLPGRKPFLELICLNRSSMNRLAFTSRDGQSVRAAHIAYSAIDRTDTDALLANSPLAGTDGMAARKINPDQEMQMVLEHALKGENEEQLCLSINVDRAKLNQHLKSIYAEFNVSSLKDLTQRWGKRRRLSN